MANYFLSSHNGTSKTGFALYQFAYGDVSFQCLAKISFDLSHILRTVGYIEIGTIGKLCNF